jgi:hypothetical protein
VPTVPSDSRAGAPQEDTNPTRVYILVVVVEVVVIALLYWMTRHFS